MSDLPELFRHRDGLRHSFVAGLEGMLEEPSLGTFILVLANAAYDAEIYRHLEPALTQSYEELKQNFANQQHVAADDVAVFKQLLAIGMDGIANPLVDILIIPAELKCRHPAGLDHWNVYQPRAAVGQLPGQVVVGVPT